VERNGEVSVGGGGAAPAAGRRKGTIKGHTSQKERGEGGKNVTVFGSEHFSGGSDEREGGDFEIANLEKNGAKRGEGHEK